MRDRPILFSGPMVRAILEGRKTQTRRVINPQPVVPFSFLGDIIRDEPSVKTDSLGHVTDAGAERAIPIRFAIGDRLYVRETWAHYQTVNGVRRSDGRFFSEVSDGLAGYRADGFDTIADFKDHVRLMSGCDLEAVAVNGDRWSPSIHMPRWASRLTLIVTDVRVQRLDEISEADAQAEGFIPYRLEGPGGSAVTSWHWLPGQPDEVTFCSARHAFRSLLNSLAKPGATWADNPWIVAISFEPHHCNIDAMEARRG